MKYASTRIARNTLFVFSARSSELISGIVTISLAARHLGVQGFGVYALIWTIAQTLSSVIAFGSSRIIIREISVDEGKAAVFVASGIILNVLMTIVVYVVATLIVLAFGLTSRSTIAALYLAVLSQLFMAMTRTVISVFTAHEKMVYEMMITILTRLLLILLFFIVIYGGQGLVGFFIALASASAVGLFSAFVILMVKFIRPQWNITFQDLKYILKESFPIALSNMIGQGYMQINVFLLKIFQDITQVSFFQAAQRVVTPLMMFPMSFLFAFAPAIFRMANEDSAYANLKTLYQKTLTWILIICLPVCFYGTVFASTIVSILFGNDFSDATGSFRIIIWILLPLFGNGLLSFLLTSVKKQKVLIISNGIALFLNVVFSAILIPKYGHIGASLAFLFSAFALFLANFCFLSKHLRSVPFNGTVPSVFPR
jgi:O-antigen/teichoic acid export membrane protein